MVNELVFASWPAKYPRYEFLRNGALEWLIMDTGKSEILGNFRKKD